MSMNRSAQRNAFAAYHPAVVFAFLVGAIVLCVLINDPIIQFAGFLCAAAYCFCLDGRRGWRPVLGVLLLGGAVAVINPLLNTRGETLLFSWWGARPYTLEALIYGISMGLMLGTVLLWFFAYNKMMTGDRLTYLFGRFAPSLGMVFTMVLRLVPSYQRKAQEIAEVRTCIGRSPSTGRLLERVDAGTSVLSALVTWALEGSIDTADSMRSRGYGTGRRTRYAKYRFTLRDGIALATMTVLFAVALAGVFAGANTVEFFPALSFPQTSPTGFFCAAASVAFLLLPTLICWGEAISWSISLSKI